MDKDEITNEMIDKFKIDECEGCDFSYTEYCEVTNDDVRDCILIRQPIPELEENE